MEQNKFTMINTLEDADVLEFPKSLSSNYGGDDDDDDWDDDDDDDDD